MKDAHNDNEKFVLRCRKGCKFLHFESVFSQIIDEETTFYENLHKELNALHHEYTLDRPYGVAVMLKKRFSVNDYLCAQNVKNRSPLQRMNVIDISIE